ncbi:MAG TPA: hypothetical protein VK888_07285, partial [Anaerolineales bacterium]|nr:hypothetical protein [Anaerolineales bacterium]
MAKIRVDNPDPIPDPYIAANLQAPRESIQDDIVKPHSLEGQCFAFSRKYNSCGVLPGYSRKDSVSY